MKGIVINVSNESVNPDEINIYNALCTRDKLRYSISGSYGELFNTKSYQGKLKSISDCEDNIRSGLTKLVDTEINKVIFVSDRFARESAGSHRALELGPTMPHGVLTEYFLLVY